MVFSRRTLVRGAGAVPFAGLLAGCGGSEGARGAVPQYPATSFMAKIVQRGKLIAGVKNDVLLFGFLNPRTNQIEGFDVDVVKELAKALFNDPSPSRLELKPVTSAQRIPALQEGVVDIVAATMTITEDRKKQIDFSDVYYSAGQRLLVKKDSTVTKIQDLDKPDKNICAAKGSTSEQNISKFAPTAGKLLFDTYPECLTALQQGRIDAISTDDVILAGLAEQDPNTKLVGEKFTDEPYGLGIAKSSTGFLDFTNGVLRTMKQGGRWKEIYRQWLGKYGPVPEPPK